MADMGMGGMDHGGMGMSAMAGMDHGGMDMSAMAGMDHGSMDRDAMSGMQTHPASEAGNPLVDMQAMTVSAKLDEPGIGLRDNGRRGPAERRGGREGGRTG